MKLTKIMLGGVALAGLMGAAPALAFTHHPGTPAEHQQTDDLNAQQLQQAQSPDTQATAPSQTMASTSTGAAPSTDQTAATQGAPSTADQTAQVEPKATQTTVQANAVSATSASNPIPLDSISNSPQTLANASVETSNGQAVGAVQRVITDAAGKAKTVVVVLLGKASRLVAIAANQLTFDQSRDVVVAQLNADQIDNLPIAPQS